MSACVRCRPVATESSQTTDDMGLGLSEVKTISDLDEAGLLLSENPQLSMNAGLYVQIEMPWSIDRQLPRSDSIRTKA